jgi:subtilase family serine protease
MFKTRVVLLVAACISLFPASFAQVQTPRKPAITTQVNNNVTMVMQGSKHPLAQARFDVGAVDPGLRMNRVLLSLSPSKEAQADLQSFLDQQQDKSSPDYHHWLTPEEFGAKFGPTPEDLQTVRSWLERQGIQVTNVAKSGLWMEISGTSAQMETAFKTQMRQYKVNGEMHIANSTVLSIPTALSPVVSGVVSLHNFFKKPLAGNRIQAKANGNGTYSPIIPLANLGNGTIHAVTPGDYANIYGLNPLYAAAPALNGSGINVGLVARSDISIQDYNDFRGLVNVTGGTITNVLTIVPDPGFDPNSGDSVEATLDAQWAGGVAQGANIQMIVSAPTATTDGVDLSAAFAVDQNQVDVLSASFGQCESSLGAAENAFFNSLWEQAAAQGISVFVSSGDNGAAGCDAAEGSTAATHGLAVSGLASTPFNTAVGGTEFIDPTPATFWSATNGTGGVSALGYIPEMVWNETCTPTTPGSVCATQGFFSLESGSGGKSILYGKPGWQIGFPAAPVDTSRDIPDVSLTAAGHDGYIICFAGSCEAGLVNIIGGTSGSSPSFAGIMAIVDQALGGRQGLANYALYRIAGTAGAKCSSSARNNPAAAVPTGCVFNDVTVGNNSVPGQAGFSATTGFDLGTGLGSVNAANLVSAWTALGNGSATTIALTVNGGSTATTSHGLGVTVNATVSATGTSPTGAVDLVSSTARSFEALTLIPGAGGTSTATSNVTDLPGGTYTMTAHYPGDSVTAPSDSSAVTLTINPESSTTTLSSIGADAQGFPILTTTFNYGDFMELNAAMAGLSTHGTATGTVNFKDAGNQIAIRTVNVKGEADLFPGIAGSPSPLAPGTHSLTAVYGGDPSFNTSTGAATVIINKGNPTVTVNPNTTFVIGQAGNLVAQVSPTGPIVTTGTVQFKDGGVNLGTPATVSAGQASLSTTFQSSGTHSIAASYSGDGTYNAATSTATPINVANDFSLLAATSGSTAATVAAGQTATYNLVANSNQAGFTGTVALTCSGAPAGTTCTINPNSVSLSSTATSAPFSVVVTTTTSASLHKFPFRGLPIVFASIFALAFAVKGNRKQLWQVAVVAVLALGISSCGGGHSSTPTPTPTPVPTPTPSTQATLVVTGTSGTQTSTVSLSLTITH